MKIEKPKNPNYAATVVALSNFVDLAGCDNIKAALIFGNSVIVAKNVKAGEVGIFFPVECQLDKEFLANNNLFRKPEFGNLDEKKKGFFEQHGRVKAVKFRGHKSEGFWIPISALAYTGVTELPGGTDFDRIGDHEICRKYVPKRNKEPGVGTGEKKVSLESQIVENQFRFHDDTANLRRNIHLLDPKMYVSISDKWHGTSAVFANVKIKRELRWYERIARYLGVAVQEDQYDLVWSSRKAIRGIAKPKQGTNPFYSADIWSIVAEEVRDRIPKGFTLYGEIVGYLPDGAPIQEGYHYGCQPNTHRFVVYRITSTNPDGKVLELSWKQMAEFCAKYGFELVRELWYGRLDDFCDRPSLKELPHEYLLKSLESTYIKDEMCPFNNFEVPAEGIVVKVDTLEENKAFKLKNFKFLEAETKALDKGAVDIESQEAEIQEEIAEIL